MTKLLAPKLFQCKNPLFSAEKYNVMEMQSLFDKAVKESDSINTIRFGNKTLLKLYSLYKQATEGDAGSETPVKHFDNTEKAKYNAWASLKGKSIKDAQCEYIMLVYKLKN
jgi:acyl-CoA-binding protein